MTKMDPLLEITAKLRDPQDGCPWDLQQTFETIAPFTIEEAYEVDHAIRGGDMAELRDELGDLLFQVALHAQMANEAGHFDFDDVVQAICEKLTRRHPHVFGDPDRDGEKRVFASPEEQSRHWEESKSRERAGKSGDAPRSDDLFRDIPRELPALARASKLRKRAGAAAVERQEEVAPDSAAGASRAKGPDLSRVEAALEEISTQFRVESARSPESRATATRTIGTLLTRIVGLAKDLSVDPEAALRGENQDFEAAVLRDRREAIGTGEGGSTSSKNGS